jgi:hypothetical protein
MPLLGSFDLTVGGPPFRSQARPSIVTNGSSQSTRQASQIVSDIPGQSPSSWHILECMGTVTNINDVLDGHVALEVDCIDRLYLNAYVPNLQVGGQVERFCKQHLKQPIASPTVIERIGNRFRRDVAAFAKANGVAVLQLKKPDRSRWDDRKLDHVRPYFDAAAAAERFGVVAIVAAQEFQWVFSASKKTGMTNGVWFDWFKTERRVGIYYFYIYDAEFGPGFIKVCTYFPYPAKVWLNGHEWAKRQADVAGIGYRSLANGFAACDDPAALQAICDGLGSADVQGFFDRWMTQIPAPFQAADRDGGYWWELSMRQVEVSRTIVFDDPRRARGFFEALVADNVGIGRPHEVRAVFGLDRRGRPAATPYETRIFGPGTEVKMDFRYKHSRVKQYLKEGRALRIETVINKPADIGVLARLEHLPELVAKAAAVNRRLLTIECAGQDCAIGSSLFECTHQPYTHEGQRAGALRFGDPRAMALDGRSLCPDPRRHRLHQPQPSRARRRTPRHPLQHLADDLRPTTPPTPRPHRPNPAHEYLRRHTRRPQGRGVLHQTPPPTPLTPPRSRPATRSARDPPRPDHHRTDHQRLRDPRPSRPRSLKHLSQNQQSQAQSYLASSTSLPPEPRGQSTPPLSPPDSCNVWVTREQASSPGTNGRQTTWTAILYCRS